MAEPIEWLVGVGGFIYPEAWETYEINRIVTQRTGALVRFIVPTADIMTELGRRTAAGTLPDLVTVRAGSDSGRRLAMAEAAISVRSAFGEDLASIPGPAAAVLAEQGDILYGVPGLYDAQALLDASLLAPREGYLVHQRFHEAMGSPDLSEPNAMLAFLSDFAKRYGVLCREIGIPIADGPIPVILGDGGSGLPTLEHAFGIRSVSGEKGSGRHRIFEPGWPDLLQFLSQLGRIGGVGESCISQTGIPLDDALAGRSALYIGPLDTIQSYNRRHPDLPYVPTEPLRANPNAFVAAYPAIGRFQTYLSARTENRPMVVRLVRYLLSEEGSRLMMLGIRNRHWILDDGRILRMKWVETQLAKEPEEFELSTGIGRIPFLADLDHLDRPAAFPGLLDDWPREIGIRPIPTSAEAIIWNRLDDEIGEILHQSLLVRNEERFELVQQRFLRLQEDSGVALLDPYIRSALDRNLAIAEAFGIP